MPAASTSTRRSTRSGWRIATSAAMKPPIELPTIATSLEAERIAEVVEMRRVAGDRDRLAGHLASGRSPAGRARSRGSPRRAVAGRFSSQFCQQPPRPWTKTTARSPSPRLDVVDVARRAISTGARAPRPVDARASRARRARRSRSSARRAARREAGRAGEGHTTRIGPRRYSRCVPSVVGIGGNGSGAPSRRHAAGRPCRVARRAGAASSVILAGWTTTSSSSPPARCSPRGWGHRCSPGGCACPRSSCSSGVGMLLGSDGARADRVRRLRARALPRASIALALILFEGGLAAGWRVDPAGARAGALAGARRHARHGGRSPASRRPGCSTSRRSRACCSARSCRATDGAAIFAVLRGSTLRRRLAHVARGRGRLQRPGRGAARRSASSSGSRRPTTASPTWRCCSSQELGDRRSSSACSSARAGASGALRRVELASAGLYPVLIARRRRARLRRRRRRCTARASSPSTSPGLAIGDAQIPAKRTIVAFHEGLAWVAQVGMFLMLGLLVFPARLGRRRARGHGDRARARVRRAAARDGHRARAVAASRMREQAALGWAGLRGAVPVVLATFPIIEGVDRVARGLRHRLLRRARSRRCCRARRSSRWRGGSA